MGRNRSGARRATSHLLIMKLLFTWSTRILSQKHLDSLSDLVLYVAMPATSLGTPT